MSQVLTFQETTFDVIDQNGQPWVQARQIGQALGYSRPDAILNTYERNKDEFSLDMTTTIELMVGLTPQPTRIFSLRGCHLLAMFARTPVAKAFRVWVLDVLDALNKAEQAQFPTAPALESPDAPITPDQQCTLQAIVKAKIEAIPEAERSRGLYPQVWGRFKNHFRVAKYDQLPQSRMSEAVAYLSTMEVRQKALPEPAQGQKALPAGAHSDTLPALPPDYASAIEYTFNQMQTQARLLRELAREYYSLVNKKMTHINMRPAHIGSLEHALAVQAHRCMDDLHYSFGYIIDGILENARVMGLAARLNGE